jgi:hypothetical protein
VNGGALLVGVSALAVGGQLPLPTRSDFASVYTAQCAAKHLNATAVRHVICARIDEEPTEFVCRYEIPSVGHKWQRAKAYIAQDGEKWVWLDGKTRCYSELEMFR